MEFMDIEGIIDPVVEIRKERLARDESLILNVTFGSFHKFSYLTPEVNTIFDSLGFEKWGDIDILSKIVNDNVGTYIEAFRRCIYQNGNDGWAALQYASPNTQRVSGFLSGLARRQRLIDAVKAIAYKKVKAIRTLMPAELRRYFAQFEPTFPEYVSTDVSSISQDVLGLFNKKRWNLYHVDNNNSRDFDKIVKRGSADKLKIGEYYHIFPIAHPPDSPDAVNIEIVVATQKGAFPAHLADGADKFRLDGIVLGRYDVRLIHSSGTGIEQVVPYNKLKKTLTEISEYSKP